MKVKICGVTHSGDGEYAAQCGADYIGLIFSDRSKRRVTPSQACCIVAAARQAGAEPVGVFVDEDAETISAICGHTGIEIVQLHGAISKQAFKLLPRHLKVIYAVSNTEARQAPDSAILLCDSFTGGSGVPFDWSSFSPPKREWFLAGGLTPFNVNQAIALLKPSGVDVSGGVELPHTARKDLDLVKAFILAAKQRTDNI